MNQTIQVGQKAIQLRRLGYSYTDISRELKVSRASVCNWVKNVRLTEHEKQILQKSIANKMNRARMKASISLRSRTVFKEKRAFDEAERDFKKNLKDPLFSTGLALYCAKSSFSGGNIQFTHSNPAFIHIFLTWMQKYLQISEENVKKIFSKNVSEKAKITNQNKGSMTIIVSNIRAMRTLIAWQKLLIQYYRG